MHSPQPYSRPFRLFKLFHRESTAAYSAGRKFLCEGNSLVVTQSGIGVLVGIEATWERHLLIFIKSSSSLDHISAWVYTCCQLGMCTCMLLSDYGQGRRVCVRVSVYNWVCVSFKTRLLWFYLLSCPIRDEKVLFKKVRGNGYQIYRDYSSYYSLVVVMCICVSFTLKYSSNEITKSMFHSPWECVLCFPFIFFSISSKWSQWLLCISLEKLKDMNIFLAPSIEKAQTRKWLAYWEQPTLCDEESVWFAKGLKRMMWTRAL